MHCRATLVSVALREYPAFLSQSLHWVKEVHDIQLGMEQRIHWSEAPVGVGFLK
jgi:hypothetical protein